MRARSQVKAVFVHFVVVMVRQESLVIMEFGAMVKSRRCRAITKAVV